MPAGPAVVITPWNAPVHALDLEDRAGARRRLHGGPQAGRVVAALLLAPRRPRRRGGLPARRLQRRPGDRRGGRRGARRPPAACAAISFTGSPETARAHRRRGGARTSSRSPASSAARARSSSSPTPTSTRRRAKAAGQYDDAGQVCLAGTRLLVEESRRATSSSSVPPLRRRARARRPARRRDDRVAAHPPRPPRARRGLRRARAREHGDAIVRGGRRGGRRRPLFYEPTLVVPRSNDSEIVQREVFGPVLTLPDASRDEDEAIALANSTRYGLSGIVYTGSEERAERVGRAVRAGTVWVNTLPRPRPDRAVRRHRDLAGSAARAATTRSTSTPT